MNDLNKPPTTSRNDFDLTALYKALEAQREARGLTWQQATREINRQAEGQKTSRALSASTVKGLPKRIAAEGDGVLQMLRWLNRSPESFIAGYNPIADETTTSLPEVPPNKVLRFDTKSLYEALNNHRLARGMTWKQLASEIGGTNPESLQYLAHGGRTWFPMVTRITQYLGQPAARFTRATDR
jgi:hypothetical protein